MKKIICRVERSVLKKKCSSSIKRTVVHSKGIINKKAQIESICKLLADFYSQKNNSINN